MSVRRLAPLALAPVVAIGATTACEAPRSAAPDGAAHACTPPTHRAVSTVPRSIAGAVSVLEVEGGNVVVARGASALVVIDPRSPVTDARLEPWAPSLARTVIVTHSHRDHTTGSGVVARGGPIIAHAAVTKRLSTPQFFQGEPIAIAPASDLPTRTYDDRTTLTLDDEVIELSHPPGAHTDGDTVAYFTHAHVAAMGDVFFPDRFPYVDPDGGGRVDDLVRAIDGYVRDWPADVKIIPGHARSPCTMDDLRTYQRMLHETIAWVRAPNAGVPTFYEGWGWSLVPTPMWVELVRRPG